MFGLDDSKARRESKLGGVDFELSLRLASLCVLCAKLGANGVVRARTAKTQRKHFEEDSITGRVFCLRSHSLLA